MKIAIIGAGAIGSAIAHVVRDAHGVTVECWDKDQYKVPHQKSLPQVLGDAAIVFLCVPSWAVRAAAQSIVPYLEAESIVVSIAKGLEVNTNNTMDEVLQEVLPASQFIAMLCGPMLADELMRNMPAAAVIGTKTRRAYTRLQTLFTDTSLYVEYSRDIHGVALVSVLKNIYAIGVGIGEGLEYGDNFRGWYVNRAVGEMTTILTLLGGKPVTVYSVAGLGDFITTSSSSHSRNHAIGKEIGTQGQTDRKSEGTQSLPALLSLLGRHCEKVPILCALRDIVLEKHDVRSTFQTLLVP